ncbi:MAG: hypothetical protein US70_C0001G0025 [Parcubacteria group bacterium GW2011_GWD2_38_11]|nr:MAG: hypothetical protein US70_C0001G0025 [Parcubacteria group bacterium GW2011_GWD2_38_11]
MSRKTAMKILARQLLHTVENPGGSAKLHAGMIFRKPPLRGFFSFYAQKNPRTFRAHGHYLYIIQLNNQKVNIGTKNG